MEKERVAISVFKETYEKLLRAKLEKQSKLGKEIIWDDFFLELIKERR
jgi:predicted CopG family antitoxin